MKQPPGEKKEATFQAAGIVTLVLITVSSVFMRDTGRMISSGIALLSSVENG
jgi:hypothetical protein